MGDLIETLASAVADQVVFIRLQEDLPIARKTDAGEREFLLPGGIPLPLTRLGARALKEDPRVFPLPALVQGLLMVLEREECLDQDVHPLPVYRAFAETMASDVAGAAERELREAAEHGDWPRVRARAAFLLNLRGDRGGKGSARLWTLLGIAAGRSGEIGKAEAWLRRAVGIDPSIPEAQAELGAFLGRLERHTEARAALLQALKTGPPSVPVLYNLAQASRILGDLAGARGYLEEAQRLAPADPQVLELKALLNPPGPGPAKAG